MAFEAYSVGIIYELRGNLKTFLTQAEEGFAAAAQGSERLDVVLKKVNATSALLSKSLQAVRAELRSVTSDSVAGVRAANALRDAFTGATAAIEGTARVIGVASQTMSTATESAALRITGGTDAIAEGYARAAAAADSAAVAISRAARISLMAGGGGGIVPRPAGMQTYEAAGTFEQAMLPGGGMRGPRVWHSPNLATGGGVPYGTGWPTGAGYTAPFRWFNQPGGGGGGGGFSGGGGGGIGGLGGAAAAGAGGGAFKRMMGGPLGTAGLAALAFTAYGVHGASDLQEATTQTAIATGTLGTDYQDTARRTRGMTDLAFKMSEMTGQSVSDSMGVIATMSESGITKTQMSSLYKPIAQVADILHYGKDKMSFQDAAQTTAGLVHDLRGFDPKDLPSIFNDVAQLGYLSPHGTNQLATQIRRFAPQFENFRRHGIAYTGHEIVQETALMDRMGMLQFGGSGINMLATMLQYPRTAAETKALIGLGIFDRNGKSRYRDAKTGSFDFFGAVNQATRVLQGDKSDSTVQYNLAHGISRGDALAMLHAFPANASRMFDTLASQDAITALKLIVEQQRHMQSASQIQDQLMNQLAPSIGKLVSNISSLATVLGEPLLKPLTQLITNLANITAMMTDFFRAHPVATKVATGALVGGSVIGAIKLAEMVGGAFAFTHLAAHAAREHLGVGAGVYLSRGHAGQSAYSAAQRAAAKAVQKSGGRGFMGSIFDFIGDHLTMKTTRGYVGRAAGAFSRTAVGQGLGMPFGDLFSAFKSMGPVVKPIVEGIGKFVPKIAMLGLEFVSVVGDVLLVMQALQFLGKHAGDIGTIIANVVHWIERTGAPLFLKAVKFMWQSLVLDTIGLIKDLLIGIKDTVMHFLTGKGPGGLFDVYDDLKKKYDAQDKANKEADRKTDHATNNQMRYDRAQIERRRREHPQGTGSGHGGTRVQKTRRVAGESGTTINGGLHYHAPDGLNHPAVVRDVQRAIRQSGRDASNGAIPSGAPAGPRGNAQRNVSHY